MARVWIEDRATHTAYTQAVAKAKQAGRTPPGRWRVRWYGPDGMPKMKTFTLKVKAEDYRGQVEARLGDGTYRDPAAGRVPFTVVAESWFESQLHLKRSSLARYRIALDTHVLPKWGSTPVDRIQYDDIAEWLTELAAGKTANGRKQGARSIRKTYVVLSRVLGFAVKSRRLAFNPANGVPLPTIHTAEHVYLDELQVEALADAAGDYRAFILLLAYTGLRWGEASALKIGRIDLTTRRAQIVEAFALDRGELYLDTPKNHERRSVPLSAFLIDELWPHIEGRDTDELLFTGPQGGALRASNFVRRVFNPAVVDAGLGELGVTPHKLRHTAASLAIASGADVNVVQTMLGHKSATMTLDVYGHLFPDRLDEVSKKMHKRRARVLAKAKAKAEKAARKAQQAADDLAALEQSAA